MQSRRRFAEICLSGAVVDQTLKTRLVGAVVLLGLAVIVLPLMLDGANEKALLADTRMPPAPDVPDAGVLLAEPPPQLPSAQAEVAQEHQPADPESGSAPGIVPPVVLDEVQADAVFPPVSEPDPRLQALANAWDVQVAAVLTVSNAERLREKLVSAGYRVRVRKVGNLHKVLVGPELRREDIEQVRDRLALDERVGRLQGVLVRYVP